MRYKFSDAENAAPSVPPGDYILEVIDAESGISTGGKTNGSDKLELKLRVEPREVNGEAIGGNVCFEQLIAHPSCQWKIDTFIKSTNFTIDGRLPSKDDEIELTRDNVIGLRGWATLGQEDALGQDKKPTGRKRNKVLVWITNRERLERRMPAPVAEERAPWD